MAPTAMSNNNPNENLSIFANDNAMIGAAGASNNGNGAQSSMNTNAVAFGGAGNGAFLYTAMPDQTSVVDRAAWNPIDK